MNVIVSNTKTDELTALDIDVIKSIIGEYNTDELVSMFKTFFYEKMIIDVTAIKNYQDINNIERLAMGLGAEKIILLLTDEICTAPYLAGLVDVGVYNFTNNINAIKRLIARPNTYDDVKKLQEVDTSSYNSGSSSDAEVNTSSSTKIIGFKNLTTHAGATTLVYMLLKVLRDNLTTGVYALEVDKRDFSLFNSSRDMRSVNSGDLKSEINKLSNAKVILIDLNDYDDLSVCTDVIYLLEPSTIKLNALIKTKPNIFERMRGKKVVLNRSVLTNKDVAEFEYEANSKVFYNINCLDDRADNHSLIDFLIRLNLLESDEAGGSIFGGIFRH